MHLICAGSTHLYELAFLIIPAFLSAYIAAVLWVSRGQLTEFFQGRLRDRNGTSQILFLEARLHHHMYCTDLNNASLQHMSRLPALVLFLVGGILSIVNLWCPSVFTESGSG